MDNKVDVIIAGAGASGIVAAISAAERGREVLLIEKNDCPGKKILASGNGRCNMMNTGTLRYYGDPYFASQVMNKCPTEEIIRFFKHYGLEIREETDGRVYPMTGQSSTVLSVLRTAMEISGVQLLTKTDVISVYKNNGSYTVFTKDGRNFLTEKIIISCGGAVQPKLGGSCDGYRILQSFGHNISPVIPALVPLMTEKKCISGLDGIRVKCHVYLYDDERLLHDEEGEVLFTEYGISGICIMQCARFAANNHTHIDIDFTAGLFHSRKDAEEEIKRRRRLFYNQSPVCLLEGIVTGRIAYAILKQAGIPMHGETAGMISDRDIELIVQSANRYRIDIAGTRGLDYAQVTSGGADCSEFFPETMESRISSGLYATGEVLNVDGDCGGYNMMFAFSSGIIAGKSV